MKILIISLSVLAAFTCLEIDNKQNKMEEAKIIEMVLWNAAEGYELEEAQKLITQLNDFVSEQPGFLTRTTAVAEDGRFLDIVYWTDLEAATTASEKAMKNEQLLPIFQSIDEQTMQFQHFKIFNRK